MRVYSKEMDVLAITCEVSVIEEPCWDCVEIIGLLFIKQTLRKSIMQAELAKVQNKVKWKKYFL